MMYQYTKVVSDGRPSVTYSWRTGQAVASETLSPLDLLEDLNSGSPVERLAKRQRFYNTMNSNLQQAVPFSGRYSRMDLGHDFAVVKTVGTPSTWSFVNHLGQKQTFTGYGANFTAPESVRQVFTGLSQLGFMPRQSPTFWGGRTFDDGLVRSWMNTLVPKGTGVGETIIELMRGDLPSAFTQLKQLARQRPPAIKPGDKIVRVQRSSQLGRFLEEAARQAGLSTKTNTIGKAPRWLSSAGSDFLGIHFSLIPTLSVIASTFALLFKVTEALYGESFRRQNFFALPLFCESRSTNARLVRYESLPNGKVTYYESAPRHGGKRYATETHFADAKLTLRATLNGRATPGLLRYYTDSESWFRDIGVWTPSLGYDILPWAWLLDWFLHLGAGIERASFFEVYPVDYAYVTYKASHSVVITAGSVQEPYGVSTITGSASTSKSTLRKQVNPFGTPQKLSSLTASQMSVLVALGLAAVK